MGLKKCKGAETLCCFSLVKAGEASQGKYNGKCIWCDNEELSFKCEDKRTRKLLTFNLKMLTTINMMAAA